MEKLYITEEIVNHEANKHLNLKVGSELEIGEASLTDDCPPKGTIDPAGPGRWVKVGGNCVWEPA